MDFSDPRRQHPVGMAILAVQFIVNLSRAAWPALIPFVFSAKLDRSTLVWGALGVGTLVALALAGAVAHYWRFQYRLEDTALVVTKGVFQRERLQIPLEKIQAIHLFQGPIQQVFGLTGLRVDTAGSSGNELQLVAVSKAEASALQGLLAGRFNAAPSHPTEEEETEQSTSSTGYNGQPLVDLNASQLFKVGLTQNHFRNAFVGLALFASVGNPLEEVIRTALDTIPPVALLVLSALSVLLFIPGFLLFLLSGVLISLAVTLFKYFRFRSALGQEGVQIEMGLLRRNVFQVPFAKIHLTTWRSRWTSRLMGFETLQIRQAQASDQPSTTMRVFVPAMGGKDREAVEKILYSDLSEPSHFQLRPVRRLRWLIWLASWAPSLLLLGTRTNLATGIFIVLWLCFTGYTSSRRYRSLTLRVHKDTVVIQKGWFWQKRHLIKLSQLQGIQWRRHLLLERRGVGHLTFHTAAGPKAFTYLKKNEAIALRDFALNQLHIAQHRKLRFETQKGGGQVVAE